MSKSKLYQEGYTQNRELSWLRFNERVLDEAVAETNPLLERLQFVAIHQSNFDEFFAVRCGSLLEQMKIKADLVDRRSGLTAKQQLTEIYKEARRQINKRNRILSSLKQDMASVGVADISVALCTKEEKKYLRAYFAEKIMPKLLPTVVDIRHPFPVFRSGDIQIGGIFKNRNRHSFAYVIVPNDLNDIIMLPGRDIRYIHTEELILRMFPSLFKGIKFEETLKFRVIRTAQIALDDLFPDETDYRKKMSKFVKQRGKLRSIRVDVSKKPGPAMEKYLLEHLKVDKDSMFVDNGPFNKGYGFGLKGVIGSRRPELFFEDYKPKLSARFDYGESIFDQVREKNVVLSYPYESMDPFLMLIKQAATDPSVTKIQMTVYRLAKNSKIVDYLCMAAAEGKQVDVLIELKARFDEQNNIDYSARLEEAGVQLYYGYEQYKVHSKICMVTRRSEGKDESVVLIATGNFNEKSAKIYTDLAFMTAEEDIVEDARNFFVNMSNGVLDGDYKALWVAPVSLKQRALELIRKETEKGSDGRIILKMNAITDTDLITALKEASCAGVQIDMIVRGICCILPGVPGKTENIHVRSIVGRYLEHSRAYVFGKGKDATVMISSADFMSRNTEHRVEIAVPIRDSESRKIVLNHLEVCLKDNTKARKVTAKGKYQRFKKEENEPRYLAQNVFMDECRGSDQILPVAIHHEPVAAFSTMYVKNKKND